MLHFLESLESRRLLSAVTLAAAEVQLSADFGKLVADAKTAKPALIDSAKAFAAEVKLLYLKTSPLKAALNSDISFARTVLSGDVGKIINAGKADALAIVSDVLHITLLDLGKPTKIAAAQVKLANNIAALEKVETPLIDKLSSDVTTQSNKIGAAISAIVTANPADQALSTDWTNLSGVFQTEEQILVPDMDNVISDLGALSTAAT
jgi:hypothetical protein